MRTIGINSALIPRTLTMRSHTSSGGAASSERRVMRACADGEQVAGPAQMSAVESKSIEVTSLPCAAAQTVNGWSS